MLDVEKVTANKMHETKLLKCSQDGLTKSGLDFGSLPVTFKMPPSILIS